MKILGADKPEDIDKWPKLDDLFKVNKTEVDKDAKGNTDS